MLEEIDGVVNQVPVPSDEPPEEAAYQLTMPALVVAPKVSVPESQTDEAAVPVMDGIAFTVAATAVLDAVVQPLAWWHPHNRWWWKK